MHTATVLCIIIFIHYNIYTSSYVHIRKLLFFIDPSGVHINVILQNLKLQEHLSHVPNEMVKRTINKLEDNSDIYETASNSYRIVN